MKRRQNILLLAALIAAALASTACSKTATNSNTANTSNTTASTETKNTGASNTTTTNNSTTATASTLSSPAEVLKASYAAAKNKDVAGFKRTIASADLKRLEDFVKQSGQNLDDLLKQQLESPELPMPESLETRNEKIDGETATLEFKDVRGAWKTGHFIKEDGEWKMKLNAERVE
ncbi:MAG TPA: hypothetical protein VEQ40_02150 [Pyrinomonadaceae bacterium]|nr:hypothetical protein [Pyrinomonadaceae bacterium]